MHFHLKKITSLLVLLWSLTGCGGRDGGSNSGFETTTSSIIIGDLDWEEIGSLKAGSEQEKMLRPLLMSIFHKWVQDAQVF